MSVATEKSFRIPIELQEDSINSGPVSKLHALTSEILNNNRSGFYNYINDIAPISLLSYITVILTCVFLSTKFKLNTSHLLGISLGIAFSYFLNERNRAINIDDLKKIEIQLESINPKPKYFYIDANIIELVYNLLEFSNYNKEDFDNMIYAIDNVLKLRLDIEKGIKECEMIYTIAVDQKNKALNSLSAIIISIPIQEDIKEKLVTGIKILQLYLHRHLDFIEQKCIKQRKNNGINIETKFINDQLTTPDKKVLSDRFNVF